VTELELLEAIYLLVIEIWASVGDLVGVGNQLMADNTALIAKIQHGLDIGAFLFGFAVSWLLLSKVQEEFA